MILSRLISAIAILCAFHSVAFAQKTKAALNTGILLQLPDNTVNQITPLNLRTVTSDIVNSIMPTAPVVSGNLACFNGTTGLLQDCAASPTTVIIPAQTAPYTPTNPSPASQSIQAQLRKIPVSCEDYQGGCSAASIQQAMTDAASAGRCFQFNNTYSVASTISLVGISSNLCLTGRGGLVGPSTGTLSAVLEIKNFTGITVDGNITINCNSNAYISAGLKIWTSGPSAQFQVPKFSEYVNCRTAIQVGDPSQSSATISEITIPPGFTYNVAQGVRVYSSQAVVNVNGFINAVDPISSGSWVANYTGTCSGTSLTVSAINTNGYLNQYDIISGIGITAGTYITGQSSGTLGGNGVYTVSQSCTSASAALTSTTRALNYWTSGGNVSVTGGETINTVSGNGYLCLADVMVGTGQYGFCSFTGGIIESGGGLAATFNPTNVVSPTSGRIIFAGGVQGVNTNLATDAITTDSTFPGTVTVADSGLFANNTRTGRNIVANNAATKIYFDLGSFGTGYLQGYAGVSGGTQFMTSKDISPGVVVSGTAATQNPSDSTISFNPSATFTYTMLSPAVYPGRVLYLNNGAAFAINSASANIITQGGAAVSSILPATVGAWAILLSDTSQGNYWRIVASGNATPVASVNITKFTASGTYTPPVNLLYAIVECVGGGAGGGGVAGLASTNLSSGGGGGGGYARVKVSKGSIGASATVTVGGGGAGGLAGNNAGAAGVSTTFVSAGAVTLCAASGGAGGMASSGTTAVAGAASGGIGSTGDLLTGGGYGGGGAAFGTAGNQSFYTGFGGSSALSGNSMTATGASVGSAGQNYGGGGSGATSIDATARAGGAGAAGIVVITEYLS